MGVCGSGVAAWAAAAPSIVTPIVCAICSESYVEVCKSNEYEKSYEEKYEVESIDGLTNTDKSVEGDAILFAYQGTDTREALYNGEKICQSCLENIINEYKAAQSGGATSGSTQVTAEVASTYSIIVPQAITLDGSGQSGTYSKTFAVTVKGDIGENQQVTVTATPPTMKCTGCADVPATFAAGYKTTWNRTEAAANSYAGTAADYTVSATLTPGEWTGTATFACSLEG